MGRGVLVGLAAVAALGFAGSTAAQAIPQPNIVLILTDDQRWDTVSVMPTVQRELVAKGVNFSNAFSTNPNCCPSRASIMTGAYSHTTGVYQNGGFMGGFAAFHDESTIATWLDAAGYDTALIGKYVNRYPGAYVPPGWDHWTAFTKLGYNAYAYDVDGADFPYEERTYSTDFLADEAVSFVEGATGPFFLYFAPFAPHGPATPAARHATAFSDLAPWRPPSYNERDISDKPPWLRRYPRMDANKQARIDALRGNQLRAALAVDEAVDSIIQAVADRGELEDTLFPFTSDNGLLWGEHRWAGRKKVAYEESIRVPYVLRYDRLGTTPRTEARFVLGIDVAPTFAAAAGISAPGAEGRSLLPLMAGGTSGWRRSFLVEHIRSDPPTYCAIRSRRSVLVTYATGERELYDLDADRYQLRNVASSPSEATTVARLRAQLARLCDPPPPGLSRRLLCTRTGGTGNDRLSGTNGYDILCGGGGDDRLVAAPGSDYVYPGAGNDVVEAGRGSDHILAADNLRDRIDCGPARDTVVADHSDRVGRNCERLTRR